MATVFFSYSHADEDLRDQLEVQLSSLKHRGIIETWHDRRIGGGQELETEIDTHINSDDIILLLVSPDFIASNYCYNIEMKRAMERHEAGEAIVIPVILRRCDWHDLPFGKLMATPPDGKPVKQFADRDEAMFEIAKSVKGAVERLNAKKSAPVIEASRSAPTVVMTGFDTFESGPRSSNLALRKSFSEQDRDRFKRDSFEYMAHYFENSLRELADRNPGITGDFRQIDANRFTAALYADGAAVARCTIFMGDRMFASGIAYSQGESSGSSSFNELLTVDADDQSMYLKSMGMQIGGAREQKLTQEGAAENYWNMLIRPLQSR